MTDQSHTTLVERASTIVRESHLSTSDKKILVGRLPFVGDTMLEIFVQVCAEDPFGVDSIVKGLKKKLEAQGNLKKLHEIVKQDRRDVEEALAAG